MERQASTATKDITKKELELRAPLLSERPRHCVRLLLPELIAVLLTAQLIWVKWLEVSPSVATAQQAPQRELFGDPPFTPEGTCVIAAFQAFRRPLEFKTVLETAAPTR